MTWAPLLSLAPLPPGHLVPGKFGQKAENFCSTYLGTLGPWIACSRYLHSGCRNEWFSTCSLLLLQKVTMVHTYTLGFLAEISFTPLLYHSGGCLGCPEKGTRSRNYNLFVRSAVFQPKWNDVQKTYKNHRNPVKSYCFLGYFQSLFNFGWKTAAQTN